MCVKKNQSKSMGGCIFFLIDVQTLTVICWKEDLSGSACLADCLLKQPLHQSNAVLVVCFVFITQPLFYCYSQLVFHRKTHAHTHKKRCFNTIFPLQLDWSKMDRDRRAVNELPTPPHFSWQMCEPVLNVPLHERLTFIWLKARNQITVELQMQNEKRTTL